MNKKIIGLVLYIIFITSTVSGFTGEWSESIQPILRVDYLEDLSLLVYCGGYNTWSPLYLLYLNTTGQVSYYICDTDARINPNFKLISQFSFTENQLTTLWESISESDFFHLEQQYSRPSIIDGSFASLNITGYNVTHTVETINIDVEAFDDIIKMINSLTPEDNDLIYNALVNTAPVKPAIPSGPQNGTVKTTYSYTTKVFDSEDDNIYVMFDWGDGSDTVWQGPYHSGDNITIEKSWSKQGTYPIKAKAIDDPNNDGDVSDGIESAWSDQLEITMPKKKDILNFFQYFDGFFIQFPKMKNLCSLHENNKDKIETSAYFIKSLDSNSGTRAKREGCAITIEIYITFYGAWIDLMSPQDINVFMTKVENDIENKWNKEKEDRNGDGTADGGEPWRVHCDEICWFQDPGCTVTVDAIIDYKKNAASDDIPTGGNGKPGKEGKHWIEARDPRNPGETQVGAWNGKLPAPNNGMETTGVFNVEDFAGVYAHEAGHLMGLGDQQKEVEVNNPNGPGKVKVKQPNKNNTDGTYNVMAWPSGWPSQEDIDNIVASSGISCPCECCDYPYMFFFDDFENPNSKWTIVQYTTNSPLWKRELYDVDVYEPPGNGLYYMEADSREAGSSAYLDVGLFTPALNLNGFSSVTLEFDRNFQDATGHSRAVVCTYSGGMEESKFEEFLLEITSSDPADGLHTSLSFNPSLYIDPSRVYINFYYTDNGVNSEKFCIDNVLIGAQ